MLTDPKVGDKVQMAASDNVGTLCEVNTSPKGELLSVVIEWSTPRIRAGDRPPREDGKPQVDLPHRTRVGGPACMVGDTIEPALA